MAVNGALAVAPADASRSSSARDGSRCPRAACARRASRSAAGSCEAGRSVALPLALQAVYLVCLPFAAREGVGAVTSFGYAYLAASGARRGDLGVARARHVGAARPDRARTRRASPVTSSSSVVARARRGRGRRGGLRGRRARRSSAPCSARAICEDVGRGARSLDRAPVAVDGLRDRVLRDAAAPLRPGPDARAPARRRRARRPPRPPRAGSASWWEGSPASRSRSP